MTRQERQIAMIVLGLIGLGALAIHFGRPFLGKPGLAVENGTLTNEVGKIVREARVKLPATVPGFRSSDAPIAEIEVTALPEDTTFGRKMYWDENGFRAQLSAVMMKMDRTSIHRPQTCITGQGWKIAKTETIDIAVPSPFPYVLKATCLTSSKEVRDKSEKVWTVTSVYIYWMVAEHRLAPNHSEALWRISQDLITSGTLHPWAYVSCFSTCAPGEEGALQARMKRLISGAVPQFQLFPADAQETAFLPSAQQLN